MKFPYNERLDTLGKEQTIQHRLYRESIVLPIEMQSQRRPTSRCKWANRPALVRPFAPPLPACDSWELSLKILVILPTQRTSCQTDFARSGRFLTTVAGIEDLDKNSAKIHKSWRFRLYGDEGRKGLHSRQSCGCHPDRGVRSHRRRTPDQ